MKKKYAYLKIKCHLLNICDKIREISHKYSADDYLSIPGYVTSSEMYLYTVYLKKPPFFAKKSVSNFFGSQSGKIKLIFLIYTFFRTSMQKFGDRLIFFFFQRVLG